MTTLGEFLEGKPLHYRGFKRKCVVTLVSPTSVAVEDRGEASFVEIERGTAAALFHNLTRRPA